MSHDDWLVRSWIWLLVTLQSTHESLTWNRPAPHGAHVVRCRGEGRRAAMHTDGLDAAVRQRPGMFAAVGRAPHLRVHRRPGWAREALSRQRRVVDVSVVRVGAVGARRAHGACGIAGERCVAARGAQDAAVGALIVRVRSRRALVAYRPVDAAGSAIAVENDGSGVQRGTEPAMRTGGAPHSLGGEATGGAQRARLVARRRVEAASAARLATNVSDVHAAGRAQGA